MNNLQGLNVILASKDSRINESAYYQLEKLKREQGSKFNPNKAYYLARATGGSGATAEDAIVNSLEALICRGSKPDYNEQGMIENVLNSIGKDIMRYQIKEADNVYLGGFTYNSCKKLHDEMYSSEQAFQNSLIQGVPFTFGANAANLRVQMPMVSSYDGFFTPYDLGAPTGSSLFGASEVLTLLSYDGAVSNITNGATSLGQASYGGEQYVVNYKVAGLGISEPTSMVSGLQTGYAGDNILMSNLARGIKIAENKLKVQIMRDFYNTLANDALVKTIKMSDIDTSFNKTFTSLLSTAGGAGEFITKILRALITPNNSYLETNQWALSRAVMHTSFAPVWNALATYEFKGGTTGQVSANDSTLAKAFKDLKVAFGGDIIDNDTPEPVDLRMLFVADPNIEGYKDNEYGSFMTVIALAPTVMATYGGVGFTNQVLLAKYSLPKVFAEKRALFLVGEQ